MTDPQPSIRVVDPNGRELFVCDGIANGRWWMTCYRKPNGSLARFKTPALPVRSTRARAESDLRAYAAERGWRVSP